MPNTPPRTYGANVVGLTISKEQRDFAQRRIQDAGLGDKVEIRLQDYRDERGQYDRIASIEMIEAVGEQFWPQYFSQLRDRLLPGGLAGIQAITIQDSLFQTYRREVDFIQRYVFPGGMLPSPQVLKSLGERFGVPVIRERIFGQDYAKTLATWRNNFRAAWPNLMPLGFDDRFRRLWEYYLAYCEAGFLSGNIDVRQVVFAKAGISARVAACDRLVRSLSARPLGSRRDQATQPANFMHMTINNDVVEAIGNTPLIKLKRASEADRLHHSRQGRVHESRPVGEGPRRQMDDPRGREARRPQAGRPRGGRRPPAIPASALPSSPARAAIAR